MYFTCLLKPLTFEITPQEEEIAGNLRVYLANDAEARWMPLQEFLSLDYYKEGVYGKMLQLGATATQGGLQGFEAKEFPIVFAKGTNLLYSSKL
jgi:hypothetical protein